MKKIAIVCGSLNRGGAERVTVHLSTWFVSQGYDVRIITAIQGKNEYEVPDGVTRHVLAEGTDRIQKPWDMIRKMRKLLNENKVESVIIMDVPSCIYAVPGCLGKGRKLIVSERNAPQNFDGKKTTRIISRWLMKLCHAYVFQTHDAKAFYDNKVKGEKAIIKNPLISKNIPAPYHGERKKNIVAVGRLEPQKNQVLLLRAFAAMCSDFPEFNLIIYGEGVLRNELETQIKKMELVGRVFLPGNLTDVLEKINDASLFVMPSAFEGMPNALIEAMALGLPCISTDCPCGGPRELITNYHNGILTPVDDCEALEQAMRKVLDDVELANKLGKNAVDIREELQMDKIGRQWEAMI